MLQNTLLLSFTIISLVSGNNILLQNSSKLKDDFDYKSEYMKISTQFNTMLQNNLELMKNMQEIMKENKEIMKENKDILLKLSKIENEKVNKDVIDTINKKFNEITNSAQNSKVIEELNDKIEVISKQTENISSAFTYLKNDQSRLEMKTVKIDSDFNSIKSNLEVKVETATEDIKRFTKEYTKKEEVPMLVLQYFLKNYRGSDNDRYIELSGLKLRLA